MADNVTLNPGTGGATVATDDVGGAQFQRVKLDLGGDGASSPVVGSLPVALQAEGAEYWPGYGASPDTGTLPLHVDPGGALITRGAVTTDEGTFRVNFANTSLAVSIGTVSVSGATVTGTGFLSADVHYKDYFKLDADGESAWAGIASVDSDTQLTLRVPYVGGTSGAASRALVKPVTGAGGGISVASGQCTITTGTTANATTRIYRDMDFAPLVYRARLSVSQRIANQSIRIGLSETFTANDRWFARFLLDGTTNTTVKCESARNPTTTPSAAETETTTITLPNGLTTAALVDYRVEQLTESCRFFINGILVAEHVRCIPSQHDSMEASVGCFNGAVAPASSTTVIVDYATGKNHNKLEIGVMSDTERIVAASAPVVPFAFTQAGVIAINTTLMAIDCSQHRSLSIQCAAMGTTGVVTPQWSNDGTTWVNGTIMTQAGASAGTFNAAGLWTTNVYARFFRLQLTTATTAGTTTLAVAAMQQAIGQPPSQPVVGTVTANAGASTSRAGFVAGAGIWYDDSSTALAANATFTGTSRDLTVTATATAMANAATYAKEVRVSAESDQSGTLWVEYSRDNTNWRRAKSAATAAVTGGGQFAEIILRPSWRYLRVGFTNGATLQARFTINSLLIAA